MSRSYEKSMEWLTQARRWTPGASQTGSKAPGRAGPLGGYPMFLSHGYGTLVTDLDGNTYLDMVAALASVTLGHAHGAVRDAVLKAVEDGSSLSLPTREEALAAEALVMTMRQPGYAEQVRFVKTGSEATEAAVRVARVATGRMRLLTVRAGYHSWHSWFQAVKPEHPGVPVTMADLIDGFEYGDVPHALLRSGQYAAVILEPVPVTGRPPYMKDDIDVELYLRELVDAAHACGTLVVFDEMVWGFRLHAGGAGGRFGVEPDLATFGKAIANGVPIAALVGPERLMRHATLVSGTFGGDRIGLAALRAVCNVYGHAPVCDRMHELGAAFQSHVNEAVGAGEYTLRATGEPQHPVLELLAAGSLCKDSTAWSLLLQGMADRSLLYHPAGGNVMYPMTMTDMAAAAAAVVESLADLNRAAEADGGVDGALRGQPYAQAFARAR